MLVLIHVLFGLLNPRLLLAVVVRIQIGGCLVIVLPEVLSDSREGFEPPNFNYLLRFISDLR